MKKHWVLFSVISAFILVAYQNCADVRLTKINPSVALKSTFAGEFCSKTTEFEKLDVKLLFMVDMSTSNIEEQNDLDGVRFDLIRSVLEGIDSEESCFQGANVKIAVQGFAKEIIGGSTATVCSASRYVEPDQALAQLQAYEDIHDTARGNIFGASADLKGTSYVKATNCIQSTVVNDLPATGKSSTLYTNFFITDGAPKDSDENLAQVLANTIEGIQTQVKTKAYGMSFQPILYGKLADPLAEVSEEEKSIALNVLNAMAQAGRTLLKLATDFASIDFCSLANSGSNRRFKVKRFGAINMTAKMEGDQLLPDSDMDGIADRDEAALNYDPQKARSQFMVLDGICRNGICTGLENSCEGINALGLSKCDVDKLSLTDGLDSDSDLIPDFIELLKGTDPVAISENFRNSDNDALPNYAEILQGSDPVSYDEGYESRLLMTYSVEKLSVAINNCELPQESWAFHIDNIPLVPTLETLNTDELSLSKDYLNHAAGENVIFVYYIVVEEMEEGEEYETQYLYGQFIKVEPGLPIPEPKAFELLGKIDGQFSVKEE